MWIGRKWCDVEWPAGREIYIASEPRRWTCRPVTADEQKKASATGGDYVRDRETTEKDEFPVADRQTNGIRDQNINGLDTSLPFLREI